ncbi:MAG TPA: ATP-grasp fold amidoligase family protein [Chitinophagaceae bacterium]|nr:ATP-grasp fold amidoligase family protein [Chitinophagaceae bacterium]
MRVSPKLTLKILFFIKQGYRLNLENPKTYNEKLNWLKLNYRNKLMPICADKFTVRQYVKDKGLEHILNELYWEGFNPEDIPFDKLPNQFVIKVTTGSGKNIICKDKTKLNHQKTIETLRRWLSEKYLPAYGEWFYDVIRPRIIIEKLLIDENGEIPNDYKVFCFNGEPKYIAVDVGRFYEMKRNIFDIDWNFKKGYKISFPNDDIILERPQCLEQMIQKARKLSEGFPHVRADFYIIKNKIYFGELTFTNGAGFGNVQPYSFAEEMGNLIKLPK